MKTRYRQSGVDTHGRSFALIGFPTSDQKGEFRPPTARGTLVSLTLAIWQAESGKLTRRAFG